MLADAFKVTVTYKDSTTNPLSADAPTAVFLKVTKDSEGIAEMSTQVGHVYEKEVWTSRPYF